MAKDFYKTLEIEKNASKEDVKKAFRKMAHKYHPDKKGGDEAKFKEVNEAYQVLSDDNKRAEYDRYGQTFNGAGPQGGGGAGFGGFSASGGPAGGWDFSSAGFDFGDIFRQAQSGGADFGDAFGFGDIFGGGGRREKRGSDVSIDISLSFKESIFGVERRVSLHMLRQCATCKGTGAKDPKDLVTCTACNGKGSLRENRRSIFGTVSVERTCDQCHGEGKRAKEKCVVYHGEGVHKGEEEITIAVPAGIEDGEMVRLSGKGQAVRGGYAGDLYVKIHVEQDKKFRREGSDLVTTMSVKLTDAILGATYALETLDGPTTISIPAGSGTGETLRVRGKGVPMGRSGSRGDLVVRLTVAMPKSLSKTAKQYIEELKREGI